MMLGVIWATAPFQAAWAANLTLVNKSGDLVRKLYIAPCGDRHWGANQLAHVLWSGRTFTIYDIKPGCYDLMIITPPWNACIVSGAALFRSMFWTISWSTLIEASTNDCFRPANVVSAGAQRYIPNIPNDPRW